MMKKVLVISIISVLMISVSITSISAQSQYEIPSWVKGIAGFWAEDKISDSDFGEGLSFLIDQGIIKVPKIQELENKVTQLEAENNRLKSNTNSYTSSSNTVPKYSNTYTNNLFGFSMTPPLGWEMLENPPTMDLDIAGIVSFTNYNRVSGCDYAPSFIIHYFNDEPIYSDDTETSLLDYYEAVIYFEESSQTKLVERTITQIQDGYRIDFIFNDVSLFPEEVYADGTSCPEEFLAMQNQYVIFLYNNGDRYDLIFSAESQYYEKSFLEFEKTANTFKRI